MAQYNEGLTPTTQQRDGQWSTDLWDCTSDCELCCVTCWCPCITFGQIAEIIDVGDTTWGTSGAIYCLMLTFTGCQYIYSCFYRAKMRSLYGLPGSECPDFCVQLCCEQCSLCQMHRELKNRGFDMSIGYHGNIRRVGGGGEVGNVPPPVPAGMNR